MLTEVATTERVGILKAVGNYLLPSGRKSPTKSFREESQREMLTRRAALSEKRHAWATGTCGSS